MPARSTVDWNDSTTDSPTGETFAVVHSRAWPEDFNRSAMVIESDSGGPVTIDEWFVRTDMRIEFTARGWTSTASVLAAKDFVQIRQSELRDVCRTELKHPETGGLLIIYIKRDRDRISPDEAWAEAEATGLCQSVGVPSAVLLAAGRTFDPQGRCTGSVIVTAAMTRRPVECSTAQTAEGTESQPLFVLFQLQNLRGGPTRDEVAERREWLRKLAQTVKRLHAAHLTHGDLYLHHAYPQFNGCEDEDVALIDFQLLRQSSGIAGWYDRVRDLWQLRFSFDRLQLDAETVQHWYACYFSVGTGPVALNAWQKLLTGIIRISRPRRQYKLWRARKMGLQEQRERMMLKLYLGGAASTQGD